MLRKISAIGFLFTGPRLPGVDTKPCWLTPKSSLFQEVAFLWNFYTLFPAWIKSSNCIPDKMTWSNIWIPRDYHGGARVESDTSLYRVTVTSFKTCKSHIMQTQRRNWIRSLVGVGIDLFQYFAIIIAQRHWLLKLYFQSVVLLSPHKYRACNELFEGMCAAALLQTRSKPWLSLMIWSWCLQKDGREENVHGASFVSPFLIHSPGFPQFTSRQGWGWIAVWCDWWKLQLIIALTRTLWQVWWSKYKWRHDNVEKNGSKIFLKGYCQATGTGTRDLGPGTWDLGPRT